MKVQLATFTSSLATLALGGYVQMEQQLESLLNKTNGDRALSDMMGPTLQNINQYGCWCYFEEDHGKGKSQPVNEVDAFCKTLHQGYDCAIIDAEEASEPECVPWEIDYLAANQGEVDVLVNLCETQNTGDNCAINACIVEGKFVADIFQAFFGGLQLDMSVKHSEGFDVDTSCQTKAGGVYSEKSCCGHYPYRHPFKTYDNNRACCQTKTYDVNVLTCCADGKARLTC